MRRAAPAAGRGARGARAGAAGAGADDAARGRHVGLHGGRREGVPHARRQPRPARGQPPQLDAHHLRSAGTSHGRLAFFFCSDSRYESCLK